MQIEECFFPESRVTPGALQEQGYLSIAATKSQFDYHLDCPCIVELSKERIENLKKKMTEINRNFHDTVIVIADASDINGKQVISLMKHYWHEHESNDQQFVFCIARKILIAEVLDNIDTKKAKKLLDHREKINVVVFNDGKAELFTS
jgi:hypothetical protein